MLNIYFFICLFIINQIRKKLFRMFKIKNNVNLIKAFSKSFKKQIINKYTFINFRQKSSSLNKILSFKFTTNSDNKEENSISKRYEYDYESPEDSNFEYISKLKKYLDILLRLLLLSFGFHYFFLQKINIITKKKEPYFLNDFLELRISKYFSKKIQKIFENFIYIHEHPDALKVLSVYKNLLQSNKIPSDYLSEKNIFIVHSEAIGCFILKNGDLFISSRLVEICKKNENYFAMFIANELAFQAMGLDTKRMLKIYINRQMEKSKFLKKVIYQGNEIISLNLFEKKEKQIEYYNRFLLFYPESIILNYFEEKEILKVALKFIKNSEYDLLEVF